ncbi:hypothetical protein F0U60_13450 [Archangium minus]|uniref:Uncharacterized protein n=1 Tax=Archangium minus TaxID=83450 RepID=A0ABY9WTH5_9BACT|nr:hypothetical protein F0U60_13450 [Archangium minus]
MLESATLQSGISPDALPAPSEGPGVPCDRCGTFVQGAPEQIGPRRVCEACAALLRKEIRLYPTWYIYLWGVLLNFTIAGVLSAINWKRLGDRTRMRNSVLVAVFGVAWTALVLFLQFKMGAGLFINVIGSRVAAQSLQDVYEQHKKAGGARANLLWPLVISVGVFVLLVIAVTLLIGDDELIPEHD